MRVAVVGGGPGGLMTARLLERRARGACEITLFEADSRLGGKVHTRRFDAVRATYEAGVAECYDYEQFGRDPLKELVQELGLRPVPRDSSAMALDGVILRDEAAVAAHCGRRAWAAVERFRRKAIATTSPARRGAELPPEGHRHPWARRTWADILDRIDVPWRGTTSAFSRTAISRPSPTSPTGSPGCARC